MLRAIERAGWPSNSVGLVFLSPADAAAALATGSVDAWSTWIPYVTLALGQGARIIVDGRDYTQGYAFEVANLAAIADKRAILSDFLGREARALDWAGRHAEPFAAVLARETGLSPKIARVIAIKNARRAVPIDAALIDDQRAVLDTFARGGALRVGHPLSQAFVPGLVPGLAAPSPGVAG